VPSAGSVAPNSRLRPASKRLSDEHNPVIFLSDEPESDLHKSPREVVAPGSVQGRETPGCDYCGDTFFSDALTPTRSRSCVRPTTRPSRWMASPSIAARRQRRRGSPSDSVTTRAQFRSWTRRPPRQSLITGRRSEPPDGCEEPRAGVLHEPAHRRTILSSPGHGAIRFRSTPSMAVPVVSDAQYLTT
jgi:hypothetical protein